jgi:hypothetical protein
MRMLDAASAKAKSFCKRRSVKLHSDSRPQSVLGHSWPDIDLTHLDFDPKVSQSFLDYRNIGFDIARVNSSFGIVQ